MYRGDEGGGVGRQRGRPGVDHGLAGRQGRGLVAFKCSSVLLERVGVLLGQLAVQLVRVRGEAVLRDEARPRRGGAGAGPQPRGGGREEGRGGGGGHCGGGGAAARRAGHRPPVETLELGLGALGGGLPGLAARDPAEDAGGAAGGCEAGGAGEVAAEPRHARVGGGGGAGAGETGPEIPLLDRDCSLLQRLFVTTLSLTNMGGSGRETVLR